MIMRGSRSFLLDSKSEASLGYMRPYLEISNKKKLVIWVEYLGKTSKEVDTRVAGQKNQSNCMGKCDYVIREDGGEHALG